MVEHRLIKMVEADLANARSTVRAEKSALYPRLSVQLSTGRQDIDRQQGSVGDYSPKEQTIGLNQLITDFGITRSRIHTAEVVADKERHEANLQRQNLLLAAVEAQLALIRAAEVVKYARQSEVNIKKQTQLENGRMEGGRGYATDVLQAKVQLAGAEARRVASERLLQEAVNRYEAVFGEKPADMNKLDGLAIPAALLPQTMEELDQAVLADQNPDVVAANARSDVSLAERTMLRKKELMPRLDLQLGRSHFEELDGTRGDRYDTKVTLRLNWSFDLGMRATSSDKAAMHAVESAQAKAEYVRIQALEEARNAWTSWVTARERAGYLNNQVAIANNFLGLGRKERELGRRSLLDLLSGETGLINAQSDAMAARIDEVLATYRVLRAAGRMTPALFQMPGVVVPATQLTQTEGVVSQLPSAPPLASLAPQALPSGAPTALASTPLRTPAAQP
jgi:outer membrane protein TolC